MANDTAREQRWRDPIVAEVREAREALYAAANYDIHTLCRDLREREEKSLHRVVRAPARTEREP